MITIITKIDVLKEKISNAVLYFCQNRNLATDNVSILDADATINGYINVIAAKIFSKIFSPMTTDFSGTPFVNGIKFGGNDIIYKFEEPANFDKNTADAIGVAVEETMTKYCAAEWLKNTNVQDWPLMRQSYEEAYSDLLELAIRRTKSKRSYKWY